MRKRCKECGRLFGTQRKIRHVNCFKCRKSLKDKQSYKAINDYTYLNERVSQAVKNASKEISELQESLSNTYPDQEFFEKDGVMDIVEKTLWDQLFATAEKIKQKGFNWNPKTFACRRLG